MRSTLELPGQQQKLLEAIAATGKPIVLVLMGGRPLAIPWAAEHAPAILEAWFPGTEGGNAIADVIFGRSSMQDGKSPYPSTTAYGRVLSITIISTPGGLRASTRLGRQATKISRPRPLSIWPRPFVTSRFAFADLRAEMQPGPDQEARVSVNVTNNSARTGEEVVQLYMRKLVAPVARPVRD